MSAIRVALFGGTFDPVHHAHRSIIDAVLDTDLIDLIVVMPAGKPWQKSDVATSGRDRLEMCRLALGSHAAVEFSDLEIYREGPTYTIDTVREMYAKHPDWQISLILGGDSVANIHTWKEANALSALVDIYAVARPGHELHPGAPLDPPLRITRVDMAPSSLSASEIRADLSQGIAPAGLHPAVLHYIREHLLYTDHSSV